MGWDPGRGHIQDHGHSHPSGQSGGRTSPQLPLGGKTDAVSAACIICSRFKKLRVTGSLARPALWLRWTGDGYRRFSFYSWNSLKTREFRGQAAMKASQLSPFLMSCLIPVSHIYSFLSSEGTVSVSPLSHLPCVTTVFP